MCTPFPTALLHKILTENPTARITIPDIKKDRWYWRPLKKGKSCGAKCVSCSSCAQCWVFARFAGTKRGRVSSGGVTESPGALPKHIRSDTDFSPVKSALG